jgi:hypothetical protein
MLDQQEIQARTASAPGYASVDVEIGDPASDASVLEAVDRIAAHQDLPTPVPTGELKYKLTMLIFPAILLIFVALYVSSLASGIDPEVGLFRAGGACLVLAVLARVAVGIIGDETRLILNDRQIVAMARSGAVRDYLADAEGEHGPDHAAADIEQPSPTAQAAEYGGKE